MGDNRSYVLKEKACSCMFSLESEAGGAWEDIEARVQGAKVGTVFQDLKGGLCA